MPENDPFCSIHGQKTFVRKLGLWLCFPCIDRHNVESGDPRNWEPMRNDRGQPIIDPKTGGPYLQLKKSLTKKWHRELLAEIAFNKRRKKRDA